MFWIPVFIASWASYLGRPYSSRDFSSGRLRRTILVIGQLQVTDTLSASRRRALTTVSTLIRILKLFMLILFSFFSFQQLAVPRADEWSRFQKTIQEIQANASSNIGEIGSPKMSPSKLPFS